MTLSSDRSHTQYDFLGRFFHLAIVNVLSNIMIPLAGTISLAFLGRLDEIHHLAGVTLAATLFDFIYYSFSFLRMGTTGITAQAVGRDDREAMLLIGLRNGLIAIGLGVLLVILQYPIAKVGFALTGASPEVKASAMTYFNICIWGTPAFLLNAVLVGWLLGREQSGKVLLLSLIWNGANIGLNYLFIVKWSYASTGAGLSQILALFLELLVGIILVSREVSWKEIRAIAPRLWDLPTIKATFTQNSNIFIWSISEMLPLIVFNDLSAAKGTAILAQNALLMQVILLSFFFFEGIAFATETLTGNFLSSGQEHRFKPLLQVVVSTQMLLGLIFAGVCILYPQTIFGLLTNHNEVIEPIKIYTFWLLPILVSAAIAFSLDGFFAGLALMNVLRDSSLIALLVGFVPVAVCTWYFHSNHILWLAYSIFIVTRSIILLVELLRTFSNNAEGYTISPTPIENELAS